jgi:hypothetical protein
MNGNIRTQGTSVHRREAGGADIPQGGEVKTSYNLADFVRISRPQIRMQKKVPYFRVGKHGEVTISAAVRLEIPERYTVDVRCNKVGTIVIFRVTEQSDGIRMSPASKTVQSWIGTSADLKRHLEQCRVTIPAVFLVERNEAEGFWIGKLQK